MNIWPWSELKRLRDRISHLEDQNDQLRRFKDDAMLRINQVQNDHAKATEHLRKIATTIALRGKFR